MESQSPGTNSMQRQTAFKACISELLNGSYVKEDGWQPNYINTGSRKISRTNVIGVVISVVEEASFKNILIDDGTGRISLRLFENAAVESGLGDIVLVIGRPRSFNNETYIVPEIIKNVDKRWFEVRKLELQDVPETVQPTKAPPQTETVVEDSAQETQVEESIVDDESPVDKLMSLIRKLDIGDGAPFDDISRESKLQNCEDYLNRLLELGEVFEVKPGRFKVLE